MENPYIRLARVLEARMDTHAARATQGLPGEMGNIVKVFKSDEHTVERVWLRLDNFKHVIKDAMVAEWEAKVVIPQPSRVVKLYSPVNPDGSNIPGVTQCSCLTRFDFEVQGVMLPDTTVDVKIKLKDGLKVGDRVLAIPVCGGQDAVIICKLVAAKGPG